MCKPAPAAEGTGGPTIGVVEELTRAMTDAVKGESTPGANIFDTRVSENKPSRMDSDEFERTILRLYDTTRNAVAPQEFRVITPILTDFQPSKRLLEVLRAGLRTSPLRFVTSASGPFDKLTSGTGVKLVPGTPTSASVQTQAHAFVCLLDGLEAVALAMDADAAHGGGKLSRGQKYGHVRHLLNRLAYAGGSSAVCHAELLRLQNRIDLVLTTRPGNLDDTVWPDLIDPLINLIGQMAQPVAAVAAAAAAPQPGVQPKAQVPGAPAVSRRQKKRDHKAAMAAGTAQTPPPPKPKQQQNRNPQTQYQQQQQQQQYQPYPPQYQPYQYPPQQYQHAAPPPHRKPK